MCVINTYKNQAPFKKHINFSTSVRHLMKFSDTFAVF